MHFFRSVAFLFIATFSSIGCGFPAADLFGVDEISEKVRAKQEESISADGTVAEAAILASQVSCGEGQSCPAGVGALVVRVVGSTYPKICGATLISANKVVTDSSCLPSGLRRRGARCRGQVWAVFAGQEVAVCSRVVDAPELAALPEIDLGSEVIVLRLARRLDVEPLKVEGWQKGISASSEVQLVEIAVDVDLATPHGTLSLKGCQRNVESRILEGCNPSPFSRGGAILHNGKLIGVSKGSRGTVSPLACQFEDECSWLSLVEPYLNGEKQEGAPLPRFQSHRSQDLFQWAWGQGFPSMKRVKSFKNPGQVTLPIPYCVIPQKLEQLSSGHATSHLVSVDTPVDGAWLSMSFEFSSARFAEDGIIPMTVFVRQTRSDARPANPILLMRSFLKACDTKVGSEVVFQ